VRHRISKQKEGTPMIPTNDTSIGFESTYSMIIRSEEKQRSRFETLVYTALIIASIFAVSQFGRQAMHLPANLARNSAAANASLRQGI
jgi:hypothetical protein